MFLSCIYMLVWHACSCLLLTLMFFSGRIRLEWQKHLKCYYASSGLACTGGTARSVNTAAGFIWEPAQETDCLSLHGFASPLMMIITTIPPSGHKQRVRQKEKKRGRWKSLKKSMYCHILQSKQRFGLERVKDECSHVWVFSIEVACFGIVFSTDFRFGHWGGWILVMESFFPNKVKLEAFVIGLQSEIRGSELSCWEKVLSWHIGKNIAFWIL